MGKVTIFKGSIGNYYFNLKVSNGEKVLASEGYVSKISCQCNIDSVKEISQFDSRFEQNVY